MKDRRVGNHGRQKVRWLEFTAFMRHIPTIVIINLEYKKGLCRGICETQESRPRYFKFWVSTSIPWNELEAWIDNRPEILENAYLQTSLEAKEDLKRYYQRAAHRKQKFLQTHTGET